MPQQELPEAWAEFKRTFWAVLEPPLVRFVGWTDRLSRWLKM